jgi:hypothetical protein
MRSFLPAGIDMPMDRCKPVKPAKDQALEVSRTSLCTVAVEINGGLSVSEQGTGQCSDDR